MPRTFLAIPVDEPGMVERLLLVRNEVRAPSLKWVSPHQLHFTLKFLGEIAEDRLCAVSLALPGALEGLRPFDLTLASLGTFPPRGPARVVWAGSGTGGEGLMEIARRVEGVCASLGFAPETRAFSPHLTLARVKDPSAGRAISREVAALPPRVFGTLHVSEVVVFTSLLSSSGPTYSAVSRHRLSVRKETLA